MKKILVISALALGGLSLAANAAPVKLGKDKMASITAGAITTQNPGGQPGGCSNNPNCQNVNPTGKAPPGQNK